MNVLPSAAGVRDHAKSVRLLLTFKLPLNHPVKYAKSPEERLTVSKVFPNAIWHLKFSTECHWQLAF